MEEEVKKELKVAEIDISDVPVIIAEQFNKVADLKKNLVLAREKAEKANLQAIGSKGEKIKLLKMKNTVESLIDAQVALSEATLQNTEAQEKSFEYQQALAEITKYLFGLGVSSIAVNRCVVKELQMKLENATEEEIDEVARNEIKNVVRELKNQEDLIKKQTDMATRLKYFDDRVTDFNASVLLQDEKIKDLTDENVKLKLLIQAVRSESNRKMARITLFSVFSFLCGIAGVVLAILFKFVL